MVSKTMVCIASGPSLTAEDCKAIEVSGFSTIAVNNSWEIARFCEVVYAGDFNWWRENIGKLDIPATKWSCSPSAVAKFKLNHHRMTGAYNSGMRAIQLAMDLGAKRVLMLGYDCSIMRGTHWHGKHPITSNPTSAKCTIWRNQFVHLAETAKQKRIDVINCSRETSLTCFKRQFLEDSL